MLLTIWGFSYLIVSMIFLLPFGITAIFFYFLGFRKSMMQFICNIGQVWAKIMIFILGCKVAVSGMENIPRNEGVCFVSNHDGYFDIVLLLAFCGRSIGFIAKRELALIPLLNMWIILIGGLYIDRKNIRKAVRTINKGVERIKSGGAMIIFPEGHRSRGRGLLPFHSGSLKLATQANAKIVPVAITGSSNVFEKTSRILRSSLKINFCPPIVTADLSHEEKKQALSDHIFSVIKAELEKQDKSSL
jgi:1-acyl-sn-glycerol-3-phosphate acyltransferase